MVKEKIELKETEIPLVNELERAIAKTRYPSFAKNCRWILIKNAQKIGAGGDIFYVRDLRDYAKISHNVAHKFFQDLVTLGYAKSHNISGNMCYYTLTTNSTKPKLMELYPYIKKTLNLK